MEPSLPRLGVAVLVALAASLAATPIVRGAATRHGFLAMPVNDRWHRHPVALLGGFAIAVGFAAGVVTGGASPALLPLLGYVLGMFLLGAADDMWHMRPLSKLAGQAIVTAGFLLVAPLPSLTGVAVIDVILLFVWLIGIVNAFNLLDNIDGLSAGVA